MKHDEIFEGNAARGSDFEFNAEVAEVFDDMLYRSVPFYREQQYCIAEIARKFWIPGTNIYDLGCSTAATLLLLGKELGDSAQMTGYDNSQPMLDRASQNLEKADIGNRIKLKLLDFNKDLADAELENASVVILCWTLQFVRPLFRDRLIKWIYKGLVNGGAMVVTEKILTNDSNMNRFFIEFYYDFKRRNGYSEQEISKKREALENILVPFRVEENIELFRRNGFEIVETFFQWYNFSGFLCVKNSS
ncbi:SAM-dependent methyltransferase YecO [Candidatus Scalindua japonica]|uniref:Carboxy-S-adenosyl-L-methionine synthase n=1 Tax=Candidatus Scalindua japonica TaxID=1284222 RepID=A0A286TX40_9BACT|nr:carboxy-S-adenosyl-L-methionine synthase CmoA [Candidatus Scalindua japonica]GAX60452.1 SAM-dependent methyltransferase YecO [Candidatus Scalindua japonica]